MIKADLFLSLICDLSFPNAFIGNPDETVTRNPMKNQGDNFGMHSHQCFLITRHLAGWSLAPSSPFLHDLSEPYAQG